MIAKMVKCVDIFYRSRFWLALTNISKWMLDLEITIEDYNQQTIDQITIEEITIARKEVSDLRGRSLWRRILKKRTYGCIARLNFDVRTGLDPACRTLIFNVVACSHSKCVEWAFENGCAAATVGGISASGKRWWGERARDPWKR